MPDDNSCLFRAFSTAVLPTGDDLGMPEIRGLVATYIQEDPEIYTKAVLEQAPDDYCRWIQTEDAWGGAIEMGILAKHFDVQICSVDVQVWLETICCKYLLNQNSLCELTDSMKRRRQCAYLSILASTTIPSPKVHPNPLTRKQTTLQNLIIKFGLLVTNTS